MRQALFLNDGNIGKHSVDKIKIRFNILNVVYYSIIMKL